MIGAAWPPVAMQRVPGSVECSAWPCSGFSKNVGVLSSRQGNSEEKAAWLALIPVAVTAAFYALPDSARELASVQFLPQALSYVCLAVWAALNDGVWTRLGLGPWRPRQSLLWGVPTGLVLGAMNVAVMLRLVPWLGGDIGFLRDTPHAQLPAWVMLPWFIVAIACFVEINFRGFLLGRLHDLGAPLGPTPAAAAAILISALTFSFDPFMVMMFRHLHWIGVWDGIVWGTLRLALRNLGVPIIAHAVEVVVMYSVLKVMLA
jgi:membrane protease YdiL (CAAX protease family)